MSQSYVLDTNILLALARGNALGHAIDSAYGLRTSLQRHVVSIASQAEMLVLAERNGWGDAKRDAIRVMFENLVVVPIDGRQLVDAYVRVSKADWTWLQGARNLGKNDVWIAATAVTTGLSLLTTDSDFKFLDGSLLTVHWVDPNQTKTVIN